MPQGGSLKDTYTNLIFPSLSLSDLLRVIPMAESNQKPNYEENVDAAYVGQSLGHRTGWRRLKSESEGVGDEVRLWEW